MLNRITFWAFLKYKYVPNDEKYCRTLMCQLLIECMAKNEIINLGIMDVWGLACYIYVTFYQENFKTP